MYQIQIPDSVSLLNLFGDFDSNLKLIEKAMDVKVTGRDNVIKISGEKEEECGEVFRILIEIAEKKEMIDEQKVLYAITMVQEHSGYSMKMLGDDCVAINSNGMAIKAKTLGQKEYVESIKNNTIVFGIGPAGTGKTYLAVARAVTALRNKEVNRIILTRPAVEAGEKLGFCREICKIR